MADPKTPKINISEQASTLGSHIGYGDPIEQDGTKILPVSLTGYGFGAGNTDLDSDASAQASGGGGFSVPLGAYVTRDGVTRFEPNIITLLVVGTPFVCFAGRAIARVIKAFKK